MEKYNFSNMNQQSENMNYFYSNDFNYYYNYQNQFYPHFAYQNFNYQNAYASPNGNMSRLNSSAASTIDSSSTSLLTNSPLVSSNSSTDESLSSPQINSYLMSQNKPNDDNKRESTSNSVERSQSESPELKTDESDVLNSNGNIVKRETRSKRRTRTQFSKQQIDCLEAIFNKSHYPEVHVVDRLSDKLGLSIERISVWFQNRRAKYKKVKKPTSSINESSTTNKFDSALQYSNREQLYDDVAASSTTPVSFSSLTKPTTSTTSNSNIINNPLASTNSYSSYINNNLNSANNNLWLYCNNSNL